LRVGIVETGDYPRDTVVFMPVLYDHPEARELELMVNGRAVTRPLKANQREWLCRALPVRA